MAWIPSVEDRYGVDAPAKFREAEAWADDSLTEWIDHWAVETAARRAVTDGATELDFETLRLRAYRFASWLRSEAVVAGDRVVVQLPNWSEFVVAYIGIARIGAILVPVMPVYRHDEVRHILESSGAVLAVTAEEFRGFDHVEMFRTLAAESPALRRIVVVRGRPQAGEVAFDDVVGADSSLPEDLGLHPHADAGHAVIFSSGTESAAKGCYHTWNTLAFTARGLGRELFQVTPEDTMWMPSPVTHSTGVVVGLVVPLIAGAGVHLQDVWEPHEGLRRIDKFGVTITASATPFVTMAMEAAATNDADLSSMRAWMCAGAPIPSALASGFSEVFENGRLLPLYGCTEILAATVCRLADSVERVSTSDGAPMTPEVALKLVDDQGREVPTGEVGEICYRGPGVILGYWNDPARTEASFDHENFFHTGDLGRVDEDGYLRVTGRVKDIIIRGGQNLSALEIEENLTAHPQIRQAAAVAYPDDRLGERVCAFVVVEPGSTVSLESLREFLISDRQVAVQKAPEKLVVLDELPTTQTGKIQKFVLRDRAKSDV